MDELRNPETVISIHALREEGDRTSWRAACVHKHFYPRPPRGGRRRHDMADIAASGFLSTPSARRATYVAVLLVQFHAISIHALREEGDSWISQNEDWLQISIHALREEGDAFLIASRMRSSVFLSTPSARRATAKTETKSLFSNKLYNILHEFRRALIYNGSKSYPNHAK